MTLEVYRIFGLNVGCDIKLGNAPTAVAHTAPDVTITGVGVAAIHAVRPAGDVLMELPEIGDGFAACATRDQTGRIVLKLPGVVEFDMDLQSGRIDYVRDPTVEPGFVAVLVTGMCLATYLQVLGHGILHASAVAVPDLDGAVAFVGNSGMGKSTMATIMGRAGMALVADDILRIDVGDPPRCHRGAIETRLRPKAASLADDLEGVNPTSDDRLAVRLPFCDQDLIPLRALVVPGPDPSAEVVELTPVTGAKALLTLLAYPRLLHWQDPQDSTGQFDFLSALSNRVPVFTSRLPWGPPFPADLHSQFLTALAGHIS